MTRLQIIKHDRMNYKKNRLSSNLTLLSVVANAVFFISFYSVNSSSLYNWLMAVSVVYNLLFMLTTVLCSQGVGAYRLNYSVVLIVVGALQVPRMFIYPTICFLSETVLIDAATYTVWMISLGLSALLLVLAGVFGILRSFRLKNFNDAVQRCEIDVSLITAQE